MATSIKVSKIAAERRLQRRLLPGWIKVSGWKFKTSSTTTRSWRRQQQQQQQAQPRQLAEAEAEAERGAQKPN